MQNMAMGTGFIEILQILQYPEPIDKTICPLSQSDRHGEIVLSSNGLT
jgi:hypothetical protein